jgi:hypothetical protein
MVDAILDTAALVPYLVLFLVGGGKGLWEEAVQGQDPELSLELCKWWNGT